VREQGSRRAGGRAVGLALCFLMLAVLGGCGFPGTVRPAVKLGLVAPFEGRYRYVGYDVIYAVRMALREANDAGGVGGYNVELVAYDDGADPAMALEQARKLAADPEVVAAIGHFREETTGAALSAYAEAGIPLVAPAVLDRALPWGEAEVYRLGPADGTLASALFYHLKGLGQYQAALVTEGGPLGTALQWGAQQYRLVVGPVVSPENADWLVEMKASGAEVVFCDASPVTTGEVVSSLREAGWEGVFLGGPDLAAPDFVAVAGMSAEGSVFVTPWPLPVDISGSVDFVAAYQAVSGGVPPGPLALPAYEATWVLLEALGQNIAAHGTPTREGVTVALPAIERDGLLGHITFDAGHNWSDAPLYWYRVGAEGVPERMP
jgi:branched-chain amino acid transport system substrate-binding protein